MSQDVSAPNVARSPWYWIAAYILFYALSSWADLWSTIIALRREGAQEANVFATADGGAFDILKALLITAGGGLMLLFMFIFGLSKADRVSGHWLRHPMRSFLSLRSVVNPFARSMMDRTPLHFLSCALALPLFRFLAAANNLLLAAGYAGPLSFIVKSVGKLTSPLVGFLALMPFFVLLVMAVSPVAAAMIAWLRR